MELLRSITERQNHITLMSFLFVSFFLHFCNNEPRCIFFRVLWARKTGGTVAIEMPFALDKLHVGHCARCFIARIYVSGT